MPSQRKIHTNYCSIFNGPNGCRITFPPTRSHTHHMISTIYSPVTHDLSYWFPTDESRLQEGSKKSYSRVGSRIHIYHKWKRNAYANVNDMWQWHAIITVTVKWRCHIHCHCQVTITTFQEAMIVYRRYHDFFLSFLPTSFPAFKWTSSFVIENVWQKLDAWMAGQLAPTKSYIDFVINGELP